MQTRCPQCNTQFRITESQASAADGLVRCGVCDEIFNALDAAVDDSSHDDHETETRQHSLIESEHPVSSPDSSTQTEISQAESAVAVIDHEGYSELDDSGIISDQQSEADFHAAEPFSNEPAEQATGDSNPVETSDDVLYIPDQSWVESWSASDSDPDTEPDETVPDETEQEEFPVDAAPGVESPAEPAIEQTLATELCDEETHDDELTDPGSDVDGSDIEPGQASQPKEEPEPLSKDKGSSDDFDFFDEELTASQHRLVPDELRKEAPLFKLSDLVWSAGILMLIAGFFIEYAWFNRQQLSQLPEMQVWIKKLCTRFDCRQLGVRAPDKIELVTRNVYSHPDRKNALMVAVTMKNNADFAQPYPVMQIDFSDRRGGKIAARRFKPGEYLQIDAEEFNNNINMLPADTSMSITMEIVDPGDEAITYEFNFL